MTCISIHIWTGAYMLNSLLEMILCFLFLGDNISGCCYHQRYQNREICKTSQSEYSIIILRNNLQLDLTFKSDWCIGCLRISAGMQMWSQALSLPISMSNIFELQKNGSGCMNSGYSPTTETHRCTRTQTNTNIIPHSES